MNVIILEMRQLWLPELICSQPTELVSEPCPKLRSVLLWSPSRATKDRCVGYTLCNPRGCCSHSPWCEWCLLELCHKLACFQYFFYHLLCKQLCINHSPCSLCPCKYLCLCLQYLLNWLLYTCFFSHWRLFPKELPLPLHVYSMKRNTNLNVTLFVLFVHVCLLFYFYIVLNNLEVFGLQSLLFVNCSMLFGPINK